MHQAILEALARCPTADHDDHVESADLGDATVLYSRESLHTINESSISLSGDEFLASTCAVDVQEVR